MSILATLWPLTNTDRYQSWWGAYRYIGEADRLIPIQAVRPVNRINLAAGLSPQGPVGVSAAMTLPPAGPTDLLVVPYAKAQRPDKQRTGTATSNMPSSPQTRERRHNAASPTARQKRGTNQRGGPQSSSGVVAHGEQAIKSDRLARPASPNNLATNTPSPLRVRTPASPTVRQKRGTDLRGGGVVSCTRRDDKLTPLSPSQEGAPGYDPAWLEPYQHSRGSVRPASPFRPRKGRALQALYVAGNILGGAVLLLAALWPLWL